MNNKAPRVVKDSKNRFYVIYYLNGIRNRVSSGSSLGIDIHPNKAHTSEGLHLALKLALSIHEKIEARELTSENGSSTQLQFAVTVFNLPEHYKLSYKKAFSITKRRFLLFINSTNQSKFKLSNYTHSEASSFLHSKLITPSSFNTERKHMSSMFSQFTRMYGCTNPFEKIRKMKEKPSLHKPFKDVKTLLEDIKLFNENLFLCCLLTYGCLLRPHQEIRSLTWGDISDDMSFISLSGHRNKSGRNRIVPLPEFISKHMQRGLHTDNIFTGSDKPFNGGYFKTLWSRYKAQSNVLEDLQTLYSFRHSGAIEIYKRTGSLTILQQAMGHASLAVTLGYLRGLEIPSLKLEDMPRL